MIPIPERMKRLRTDARGYPVPWGVMIDANGLPHFAVNREDIRQRCLIEDRCSICGGKLFKGRWFVGGALSAFHADGAFIDPPMHAECAAFALQVCPYLAAPRYTKEIGLEKAMRAPPTPGVDMILLDTTLLPGRPAGEIFVAIMATRQKVFENFNSKPIAPFKVIQFWRHGHRISDAEGMAVAIQAVAEYNVEHHHA